VQYAFVLENDQSPFDDPIYTFSTQILCNVGVNQMSIGFDFSKKDTHRVASKSLPTLVKLMKRRDAGRRSRFQRETLNP
jgi:hypothetical protein